MMPLQASFLGMHKWEPDIYIGFSQALYLQCKEIASRRCTKGLIILLVLYQQGDNSRVRCGTTGIAEALPSGLLAYAVPRGLMLYQETAVVACSKKCDVADNASQRIVNEL
jgi:hypothetical protein